MKTQQNSKTQRSKAQNAKAGRGHFDTFDGEIYNIIDAPGPCCYSIAMRWDD